jgi:hypothetical protein
MIRTFFVERLKSRYTFLLYLNTFYSGTRGQYLRVLFTGVPCPRNSEIGESTGKYRLHKMLPKGPVPERV